MKNYVITFLIVFTLQIIAFGQVAKMYAGKEEFILHRLQENTLTYFSSSNPNGVLFEIKKQVSTQYLVSFPKQSEIYDLKIEVLNIESNVLHCTNPDGTKQDFYNPTFTDCYQFGQGSAEETIFAIGPPPMYVYFSARFPTGVLLKIVGGDMMTGLMKISFPNEEKVYELTEEGKTLKCKNPDGTIQSFLLK